MAFHFHFRFARSDVRIVARERVFDGHFAVDRVQLQHRLFEGGWGETLSREVFERGEAVGVLPYDPVEDQLILLEQFRAGTLNDPETPWMLELIAGVVDEGESDETVAHREAEEEAGCVLGALEPLVAYYPSAGACSEHVRLFCGQVMTAAVGEVRGLAGEGEDILVHALPREEVFELLDAGKITNGHTLVALLWFRQHWQRLQKQWCDG